MPAPYYNFVHLCNGEGGEGGGLQGPEDLDHLLLLSQDIGKELNGKWNIQNTNQFPYGIPALAGGGLAG